jgi:hypothetical protein
MKKNTILNVAFVTIGLALSLFFAIGGYTIFDNSGIPTPGVLASRAFVPPTPGTLLGNQLEVQMFVDWIFWFAVMCGIYFLVAKLGGKPKSA